MRTSIFTNFGKMSDDFRDDFNVLWSLKESQRSQLIPYIIRIIKTDLKSEYDNVLQEAIDENDENIPELLTSISLLQYLAKSWNPIEDKPDDFLRDIGDLGLIPSEKTEEAYSFLVNFLGEIQKDNFRRIRKFHATALLPSFIGLTTLIDFRAVIDEPYSLGKDINDYDPNCLDFVPIVLVKLMRDAGEQREIYFQSEKKDIQMMIDSLEAALKDLECARNSIPE